MTDEEIICTFMEPRPADREGCGNSTKWWRACVRTLDQDECETRFRPQDLTLDRLREVEERLTDDQWFPYESEILRLSRTGTSLRTAIHLSAEQKKTALAAVLREGVAS